MSNDWKDKLSTMGQAKEEIQKKATTVEEVVKDHDAPLDFAAIAEELSSQTEEQPGLNDGYVKTTLYLEENVFKAFQALTRGRGEKKAAANEAIADWVAKEYNRRKNNQ